MDSVFQDVRYALRIICKAPAFSALVVLMVAIGVGAATTIFSMVEGSLLWNKNPNVDRWVLIRAFFPRQNLREFHFSLAREACNRARAAKAASLAQGSSYKRRAPSAVLTAISRRRPLVSQVALAMVVLVSAGLMIRTYDELQLLDVGYNAHNALTAQLALPPDKYPTNDNIISFYRELIERLDSYAGIDGAAVAPVVRCWSALPMWRARTFFSPDMKATRMFRMPTCV